MKLKRKKSVTILGIAEEVRLLFDAGASLWFCSMKDVMKMIFFNKDTSMGQRKNSESPTGIEPMAFQIPVGRSNQLSYKRLVVN